jgi:hypothetical protein
MSDKVKQSTARLTQKTIDSTKTFIKQLLDKLKTGEKYLSTVLYIKGNHFEITWKTMNVCECEVSSDDDDVNNIIITGHQQ